MLAGMPDEATRMTVGEHLEELRKRLLRVVIAVVVGLVVCFIFGKHIFRVLYWPLSKATGGQPPALYFRNLTGPFLTYCQVSLITGAILVSPYAIWEMWQFIGAGLYESERRAVRKYFLPSVGLFVLGGAFFLVVVAPLVTGFFLNFGQTRFPQTPTTAAVGAGRHSPFLLMAPEYVSFMALLGLVFGIGFQTPLVVVFLGRSGIVPVAAMKRFRRHVVMVILIVSAIVTPADVASMIALAAPMYVLYEVGLFVAARGARPAER